MLFHLNCRISVNLDVFSHIFPVLNICLWLTQVYQQAVYGYLSLHLYLCDKTKSLERRVPT